MCSSSSPLALLARDSRSPGSPRQPLPRNSHIPALGLTALALLLCVQAWSPASDEAQPLRRYLCHRATTPIVIDGRLDETAWRAAQIATRFTDIFHKDRRVALQSRVRLLWDEDYLYASFAAMDDDVWATKTERDAALWEEEVVELYLDPDGDRLNYLEFEVNPLGTPIDLLIPYAGAQAEWQKCAQWNCAGLAAAARVFGTPDDRTDRDHGWTAELAIPFAALPAEQGVPPLAGTLWRAQFFRIDRPADQTEPSCSSWNDTPVFHLPERFGELLFTEAQAVP